jgi:hypothetical protein
MSKRIAQTGLAAERSAFSFWATDRRETMAW